MKRLLALMALMVFVSSSALFATSTEFYNLLWPKETRDSTYAQMTGVGNAVDLWVSQVGPNADNSGKPGMYFDAAKIRYSITWSKSANIDTLHVIVRTSCDGTNWAVIDSQDAVASGTITHMMSLSDTAATALQHYVQIYAKLAATNSAAAMRTQPIFITVYGFNADGSKKNIYYREVTGNLTEAAS